MHLTRSIILKSTLFAAPAPELMLIRGITHALMHIEVFIELSGLAHNRAGGSSAHLDRQHWRQTTKNRETNWQTNIFFFPFEIWLFMTDSRCHTQIYFCRGPTSQFNQRTVFFPRRNEATERRSVCEVRRELSVGDCIVGWTNEGGNAGHFGAFPLSIAF